MIDNNVLPFFALDRKARKTDNVNTKIIKIATVDGNNGNRSQLARCNNGTVVTQNRCARIGGTMNGVRPLGKVTAYQVPIFHLFVGIVFFAVAEIVKHNGRGVTKHLFVGFDHCFFATVYQFQGKSKLGRGEIRCLIEVPNKSAKGVLHAVAKQERNHVFALLKKRGNIVRIVRQHLIGVDNIWRKMPFCNAFSVDVNLVKTERTNRQFRLLGNFGKHKIATHIGRGNPIGEGAGLA